MRAKRRVYERDQGQCVQCGRMLTLQGSICDHRVALALGGADDDANKQTLCPECNARKTRLDRKKIRENARDSAR